MHIYMHTIIKIILITKEWKYVSKIIRLHNKINERFENNIEVKLRFHVASFNVRYSYYSSRSSLFFFLRIILPYYFLTISIEIYSQPVLSKFGRLVTAANRVTTYPFDRSFKIQPPTVFFLPTVLSFYVTSLNFRGRAVELSVGTCSSRLNLNTDREQCLQSLSMRENYLSLESQQTVDSNKIFQHVCNQIFILFYCKSYKPLKK